MRNPFNFRKKQVMPVVQPRNITPKKRGCEIKIEKTAHGMKLRKSPECKSEDVEAFVRAFNEKGMEDAK